MIPLIHRIPINEATQRGGLAVSGNPQTGRRVDQKPLAVLNGEIMSLATRIE
jgi:hypothetical protein